MAQECGVCTQPVGDQATICAPCTGGLMRRLKDMPELADDLETTMSRQDRLAGHSDGGKSSDTPLFWKDRAGDALRVLRDMLRRWTEQFTHAQPDTTDVPVADLARVLANLLGTIRQHEAAPQFAIACEDATRECRRIIDKPADRVYLGPCGLEDGQEATCREELFARPRADTVACKTCGREHSVHERRTVLLDTVEDRLVTYSEASKALPTLMDKPLAVGTIRQWVHREQLEIKGYLHRLTDSRDAVVQERIHPKDPPVVRVGDVIRLTLNGPEKRSA